jgi:hypothetical protein
MYYRVYDEENKEYLTALYNEESKSLLKANIKGYLLESSSEEDVSDVVNLKFDQFVVKLRELGFRVESQPTPYDPIDEDLDSWQEYVEGDDLDNEDNY